MTKKPAGGRAAPAAAGPDLTGIAVKGAGLVASHFFRKLFVLPLLAIGAVMWTLVWCGAWPRISALAGDLWTNASAQAQVESVRLVCTRVDARNVALLSADESPVRTGGCRLREQLVLGFRDEQGAAHRVLATPGGWGHRSTWFDDKTAVYDYERVLPFAPPSFALEPGAATTLESTESEPGRNQLQALRRFAGDRWLWTSYQWLRPSPDAPVALRYRAGNAGRAWLGAFVDAGSNARMPLGGIPILGFAACWMLFHCGRMLFPDWSTRRFAVLLCSVLLASPLWAPKLLDGIDYFAERADTAARLHEEFSRDLEVDDGRVQPLAAAKALEPLAPDEALGDAYRRALDGLWPERPTATAATLGEADKLMCTGVRSAFEALPVAARVPRYGALAELVRLGSEGPARCLVPVAIATVDAAHRPDAPYEEAAAEREFLVAITQGEAWGDPNGVHGYRQRDFAPGVLEALRRDEQRRYSPGTDPMATPGPEAGQTDEPEQPR